MQSVLLGSRDTKRLKEVRRKKNHVFRVMIVEVFKEEIPSGLPIHLMKEMHMRA